MVLASSTHTANLLGITTSGRIRFVCRTQVPGSDPETRAADSVGADVAEMLHVMKESGPVERHIT